MMQSAGQRKRKERAVTMSASNTTPLQATCQDHGRHTASERKRHARAGLRGHLHVTSAAASAAADSASDLEGCTLIEARSHHWRVRAFRNTLKLATARGRAVTCWTAPPHTGTQCTWPLEEQ